MLIFKYSFIFVIYLCTIICIEVYSETINNESKIEKLWNENWGKLPENRSDIVTILFYKYASNYEGLTSSEFEALVQCSKGSSSCPYSTLPKLQETESPYSLLTDCDVNSDVPPMLCDIFHRCLDGNEIGNHLFEGGASDDNQRLISKDQLKLLLPFVLFQAQSRECNNFEDKYSTLSHDVNSKKPSSKEVWGYGLLFVTLISAMSLAGVSVIPLMAKDFYQKLLTVLIGLAVGSLAASSVFHLIPQAFGLTNNAESHHDYLIISLWILIGIYIFFMVERIMKLIIIVQKDSNEKLQKPLLNGGTIKKISVTHQSNELMPAYRSDYSPSHSASVGSSCGDEDVGTNTSFCGGIVSNTQLIYASQEQAIKASFGHELKPKKDPDSHHEITFRQGEDSVIATVAWMIIFGDGFHNFIDGVSIGAAFQESILTGVSISLAVMCEELPHELGDFAVLLNSGMTMKQAVFYNFLSATTCYAGLIVGILLGEFTQDSSYIFAIAAGMFLYISLVDMLPEMNETGNKAAEKGTWNLIKILLLQNLGMFLGVFSLFILAYYQDQITLGN